MYKKLSVHIQKYNLFTKDRPVLVGVSGGADSMSLLHALHHSGYQVICAHFNHMLRPGSGSDEAFVRSYADRLAIPFISARMDVEQYSAESGLSLEEAGRILRYRFLFEKAREFKAQAVATGHTADDQVETVLMHFLRGAGVSGLKGMRASTILPTFDMELPLVRPLLETSREEVLKYCRSAGIDYLEDESNTSLTFFRNRLRHELIPLLKSYNTNFKQAVLRNARALALDEEAIEQLIQPIWESICTLETADTVQIDRRQFLALSEGVQARIIRLAVQRLRHNLRDFDQASVLRAIEAAVSDSNRRAADLTGGLKFFVEGDTLSIAPDWDVLPVESWPQLTKKSVIKFDFPGVFDLANGWRLAAEIVDRMDETETAGVVIIDAGRLKNGLQVRCREPGDRFYPAGLQGHSVKVTDYMVNQKLPKRVRTLWPIVVSGDEIVWIVGKRVSARFTPNAGTARLLRLRLLRG